MAVIKTEIEPCPFCGKDPNIYEDRVYCCNRGCFIYLLKAPLCVWNKRPKEEKLKREVSIIRKLLSEILKK